MFDGLSCVVGADGEIVGRGREFEEDLIVVDLDVGDECAESDRQPRVEPASDGIASMHKALVLGLRDYVTKCGFDSVVIGLSGGIDSAVVAALAAEAFGPGKVQGVALPSRYSSGHSVQDAEELAENLGIAFQVLPIEPMHAAFMDQVGGALGGEMKGLTEENLQARIRGVTLMAFSNDTGALLLTTGNKSELAVGYCTLYGDMCGGLAAISDVPKGDVYRLARQINDAAGRALIPESTIAKPRRPSSAPTSSTRTRCRTTTSSTRSWRRTSRRTARSARS